LIEEFDDELGVIGRKPAQDESFCFKYIQDEFFLRRLVSLDVAGYL
jgi:hypothetical protein